ncbi:Glycolate oxidase subunit D-like protein [Cavenderia fasciculata]|uniref:D-lactate dehydrogenase (cytochrome) n=1 Tax=Cavenderia fasciculata TaxID=261658 RepID=F4Q4J3_CACFS|nr:Glycolate oxidase subunit D-like protein [Cavenderia fasciculata]EGG17842.1 Glycolate oxidase subunit D-like protein [Cavenderia fasciculata]|eukprot:XP_004356326.1 Glycolate oxidase subunit D-like protein [Cavenderia fasciculata]
MFKYTFSIIFLIAIFFTIAQSLATTPTGFTTLTTLAQTEDVLYDSDPDTLIVFYFITQICATGPTWKSDLGTLKTLYPTVNFYELSVDLYPAVTDHIATMTYGVVPSLKGFKFWNETQDYLFLRAGQNFNSLKNDINLHKRGLFSSSSSLSYVKLNEKNKKNQYSYENGYQYSSSSSSSSTSTNNNRLIWTTVASLFTLGCAATTSTILLLEDNNPHHNTKESRLPIEFISLLISKFGDRVVFTIDDREAHGKDFSYHPPENPDAVIYPTSQEEVQLIARLCADYNIPIIPFGSGTSLEGHILATNGGVCVDFKLMKSVIKVRPEDMDVTVQPGISYDELNEHLKPFGFFFPMDPGPGASIGGMVGTSCSGTHAMRYGTMKENVVSLKVVLPNGKLVTTKSRAKKSSAGYDLTHLFIGAEGTLGIVTEVTVKLQPIPQKVAVAHATFENIGDACNSVIKTMQSGVQIGRAELLDDVMMKAVNLSSSTDYPVKNTLLFEFSGSPQQVQDQIAHVEVIARANGATQFSFATEEEEKEKLWFARKVALWSAPSLKPGSEVIITDVCVPISRLSDIIEETKAELLTTSIIAPLVSHAGDGNFHLFILFNPNDPFEVKEAKQISDNLVERAIGMNGTCTGEHGVALGKKKYLEKELGKEAVDLMKLIKKTIDPKNLMNPGKVVDV